MRLNELLIIGHPDLMAERQLWLASLDNERRLSDKTVEAYERDTRQFLQFLTGHLAGPAKLSDISALRPGDLVELICEEQTVDDLAALSGTIGYEILTSLGRRFLYRYQAAEPASGD